MLKTAGDRMHLGTRYLSGALNAHKIEHRLFDLNHDNIINMFELMNKEKLKYIGLSFLSPAASQARFSCYP